MVAIDVGREDVKRPGVARHFEGFRWDGIEGLVARGARGALLQHGPDLLRDLRVTVVELLHLAIQDLIALMRSGFPGMKTVKLSLD